MKTDSKHIVLKTFNLVVGYLAKKSQTVIASDLNIELQKGTFVCLLGKNGIGKSTLLRTLSKVQPKLNGDIFINDKNLETHNSNELSKTMSLVLTERLPESNLTVFELIALGRQPYTNWVGKLTEDDIAKINEAIQLTNIKHLAHKKYYELSDGQLQKVLISRALAQDTDIIILDEPTAHLDVQHKMETFKLLQKLSKELNKTILVSTHEIHLALQSANELWLMTDNNFIIGKPQELINNESIDSLFSSEFIQFNKEKQQFVLNKNH